MHRSYTVTANHLKYERLVTVYHKDLYKYACWLIGNATVAQDVLQETYLKAWKGIDSLNDEAAAKPWLITILRRENARRFERKQFNTVDIDDVAVIDEQQHSDEQLIKSEIREHIMMLSEEYRDPLLMQVVLGFDTEQISQVLGIHKKTVLTRLFRARNQLRTVINNNQQSLGGSNG